VNKNDAQHKKGETQNFLCGNPNWEKTTGRRSIHYNPLVIGFTKIVCQSLSAGLFL